MNAINAVMLRPEMPPALPEVTMAPATIFPEPMKLTQPDHLKRGDFGGNSSQGNSWYLQGLVGLLPSLWWW